VSARCKLFYSTCIYGAVMGFTFNHWNKHSKPSFSETPVPVQVLEAAQTYPFRKFSSQLVHQSIVKSLCDKSDCQTALAEFARRPACIECRRIDSDGMFLIKMIPCAALISVCVHSPALGWWRFCNKTAEHVHQHHPISLNESDNTCWWGVLWIHDVDYVTDTFINYTKLLNQY